MTKPLALVLYDKVMPGGKLVNRLEDLGYRVHTIETADTLVTEAAQRKPLVVFTDLMSGQASVCDAIKHLKQNPATKHLPVIAFAAEKAVELQESARQAGATLVVNEVAVLNHLDQWLDRALLVE